ncbi:MAG: phosphoadenosine phosphosulfate reductase family protein [Candidatus Omnitrophica bacterium]|nr:phosphoadenosine phosphosulfate reductase family protein [Candidatus Omnitrophota bacterium]
MERFEPKKFIAEKIRSFRAVTGDKRAIVAISGGIDSLVCFEIVRFAAKDQKNRIIPFILDTGLLRENEIKEMQEYFQKKYGIELQKWDRQNEFFAALKGIVSPEQKRTIFRDVFYRTMSQAIRSYDADIVVQGTILPDIIETQKGIKTHFNVLNESGINPLNFGLRLFEPLKELTKTRVRMVAKSLAIPPKYLRLQPFPGPGFAIRITGEVTFERVEKIRKATVIVESELNSPKIFQGFPVLLTDRVTGIHNDSAVTGDTIAIRIVEVTKDSLLAKPYRVPWIKMEKITKRILNEVPGIVRVLYDVTPKPPGTIEFA